MAQPRGVSAILVTALMLDAAVLGPIATVHAQTWSGTQLFQLCTRDLGDAGDAACSAYIRGFSDGLLIGDVTAGTADGICLPYALNQVQARALVDRFLREHPEMLDRTAALLVFRAIQEAFPCPNSN